MTRAEEYRLSQYQHLGALREDKSIDLVRNQQTGLIGVQKVISSELYPVYLFLKEHTNPYLPVIYECIQLDENRLLIIEEYETGKNLEECLESGMKFSEEKAAGMIRDLCMALQPLHDAKPPIICRDLKTENVMLTADHRIKLIDFDIARQYQPGKHRDTVMMGTEGYAAPEQFGCAVQLSSDRKIPGGRKSSRADGRDYFALHCHESGRTVSECYRTDACTGESSCTKIFGANGSFCDSIESC